MALTVRPDDEVYQFDTVWLGPDEYTLPIQARYVAWGTWLACFLVAAVVLIPIGGNGPAGVLGSLIWSLGLSVVLSRAVMLVVDHERPLRSLPALFSAEARAALAARRRSERALLVRPGKIRVRETPPKVLAMRERQRARAAAKSDRRRPAVSAELAVVEPVAPEESAWTPDLPADEWYSEPTWSVSADDREDFEVAPVPAWSMPAGERYVVDPAPVDAEVHEFVRAPDPEPAKHAVPEPVFTSAAAATPAARTTDPASRPEARSGRGEDPAARPAVPAAAPAKAQHQGVVQGWTGTGAWPAPQARAAAHAQAAADAQPPAAPRAATVRPAGQPAAAQARPAAGPPAAAQAPAEARPAAGQPAGPPAERVSPFRADPQEPERGDAYRGPVTVNPDEGKHAKPTGRRDRDPDPHAALEARILLPARKDR